MQEKKLRGKNYKSSSQEAKDDPIHESLPAINPHTSFDESSRSSGSSGSSVSSGSSRREPPINKWKKRWIKESDARYFKANVLSQFIMARANGVNVQINKGESEFGKGAQIRHLYEVMTRAQHAAANAENRELQPTDN
jgi:hypothetical protein